MRKVLFIQPLVPHYRIGFFDPISELYDIKILTLRNEQNFKLIDREYIRPIRSFNLAKIEIGCFIPELRKFLPEVVITYGEVKNLSNFLLILLRKIYKFKLVFWSPGFKKGKLNLVDKIRLFEFKLADGVLFYTKKGAENAEKKYRVENSFYLNNTLDITEVINNKSNLSKKELKEKYNICSSITGAFISRFTQSKDPELLKKIMLKIHEKNPEIGFIIIGDGENKPVFKEYEFIYDLGSVYDPETKAELLAIADFAIMPRWIGLSIVECYANKLPMFTLSDKIKGIEHSVEFNYLKHGVTGYIASSEAELVDKIADIKISDLEKIGENAYHYATGKLNIKIMIDNFIKGLNKF